jgi:hypothetical protein
VPLVTALRKNLPAENTQRQLSRPKPTGVVEPTEIIIIIIIRIIIIIIILVIIHEEFLPTSVSRACDSGERCTRSVVYLPQPTHSAS